MTKVDITFYISTLGPEINVIKLVYKLVGLRDTCTLDIYLLRGVCLCRCGGFRIILPNNSYVFDWLLSGD